MASKPKTPEQAKADLEAKQRAKEAAAEKKAERAAELDAPMSDEEAQSLASAAAKGLADGGSLTDEDVQRVSGKALSEIKEDQEALAEQEDRIAERVVVKMEKVFRDEVENVGNVFKDLEARIQAAEDSLDKMLGRGPRKRDASQFGSIDGLGKIENLQK